jgi:hypothetical protein
LTFHRQPYARLSGISLCHCRPTSDRLSA